MYIHIYVYILMCVYIVYIHMCIYIAFAFEARNPSRMQPTEAKVQVSHSDEGQADALHQVQGMRHW